MLNNFHKIRNYEVKPECDLHELIPHPMQSVTLYFKDCPTTGGWDMRSKVKRKNWTPGIYGSSSRLWAFYTQNNFQTVNLFVI